MASRARPPEIKSAGPQRAELSLQVSAGPGAGRGAGVNNAAGAAEIPTFLHACDVAPNQTQSEQTAMATVPVTDRATRPREISLARLRIKSVGAGGTLTATASRSTAGRSNGILRYPLSLSGCRSRTLSNGSKIFLAFMT